MNRRRFVQSLSVLSLTSLAQAVRAALDVGSLPLSDYDDDSTAEEVTEGMDLTGRTALITGCNSGLGLETMRVLAMRGAHVIGTARTAEKGEEACASIEGETTPVVLELSNFESVVRCAEQIKATGKAIDMLICNAGIMALPELEQVNGLERHFVVNHLGHFILVNQLLDQVCAAEQGRIIILSSGGHEWAPESGIEFDNLSGERDYEPYKAYGQSKLANGLFSRELARRFAGTPVTSNSVHPGIIYTNLGRHMPRSRLILAKLIGWTFMKSVPEGAATSCYVATQPALARVSGYYFADCNPTEPSAHMENDELAAELWDVSEDLTRDYLPARTEVAGAMTSNYV